MTEIESTANILFWPTTNPGSGGRGRPGDGNAKGVPDLEDRGRLGVGHPGRARAGDVGAPSAVRGRSPSMTRALAGRVATPRRSERGGTTEVGPPRRPTMNENEPGASILDAREGCLTLISNSSAAPNEGR